MSEGVRLEFDGLAKRFDLRVVFRAVSGAAEPGEVLAITGPNGSGKSTLLTILCGLLRATRGEVRYLADSAEIPRDRWRKYLGIVAPAMSLYENLDALENLRFLALVRGMRDSEARCCECLEAVGLDPARSTTVRGFSTGMHQRLKIAQAILHDPPVLFLDEPGSNLDPAGQDWLEELVARERGRGKTVVLATNDRREMEWGTRRVALSG
ncbi:MAG: ABC transporter ATP-binding protein [Acidobacteria bacterium]|nr:ABC transporter ATP-binding protein [Acidobacteriota bacterium]